MSIYFVVFVLFTLVVFLLFLNLRLMIKLRKLVSRKHSIASSYGKLIEQLVPFADKFPGNPRNFRFIGNPVDGIIFDDDGIKFVEIKSRGGKLSKTQKRIKNLVKKKKVSWHEVNLR